MTDQIELDRPSCCCSFRTDSSSTSSQERTPILDDIPVAQNHRNKWELFGLISLGLILVVGLTSGVYLLCAEGEEENFNQITLISRTDWDALPSTRNLSKPNSPVKMVEIIPINSTMHSCNNDTSCTSLLKNIQYEHMKILGETDILYNFLLDNDGRIYEGRGWQYLPANETNEEIILSIGLIGNSGNEQLSKKQLKALLAFLEYAVLQKQLIPCYQVVMNPSQKKKFTLEVYQHSKPLLNPC